MGKTPPYHVLRTIRPAYSSFHGFGFAELSLQGGGVDHWPQPGWSIGEFSGDCCCSDGAVWLGVPDRSLISVITHVPRAARAFASSWVGSVPNCMAKSRQYCG